MTRKHPSLFSRLFFLSVIPLMILIIITVAISSAVLGNKTENLYDNMLLAVSLNIKDRLYMSNRKLKLDMDYFSIDTLNAARNEKVFYRIEGPDGIILAGFRGLSFAPNVTNEPYQFYDTVYAGTALRALEMTIKTTEGEAKIVVAESQQGRMSSREEVHWIMLIIAIFMCLSTAATSYFAVRKGLRPLNMLQHQVANRSELQLDPIVTPVPIEINKLVKAINQLMARLKLTIDEIQTFNADLSHQLRTPLAEMKTHLALMRKSPSESDLQHLDERINYMSRTTQQLLHYAKSKHSLTNKGNWHKVDLVHLCQRICMSMAPRVYANGQTLEFDSNESPLIRFVDAVMLEGAMTNLLDNACKYAVNDQGHATGIITVSVLALPEGDIELRISDEGQGIPEASLLEVTKRHLRLDQQQLGSGLGLTIVKQICEQHNATLALSNRSTGGLQVSIIGFNKI